MPGSALARGPISAIFSDTSCSRAGSTLKLVTRTYMGRSLLFCRKACAQQDRTPRAPRQRQRRGARYPPGYAPPLSCSLPRVRPSTCIRSATGMLPASADVVVVGGGNAALCAALAAREHGVSVLVLERA